MNLGVSDSFKQLLKDGEKAFKHLHKKGSYKPEDLKTEKPYQKLIQSTFDAFDFAIKDNDMPEVMRAALQEDARLFGSLKANAQLFEASKLLLNNDGRLKPFSEVSKDFDKLNVNYNQNYLEAEYEFAVASSQAAAQWANLGDRYNLQYRTAQDERVRASHQVLADITLPKEDAFWGSFYPPNGWRCRCVAVEVLKGKYDESDSAKAITAGEKATTEIGKDGKNRLEIFRFNPGAQKVVFPPAHPYGKVKGAKQVEKQLKTDKNKFIPTGIDDYENKTGVKVNRAIFSFLKMETPFHIVSPDRVGTNGAFFHPDKNYVVIPIDKARLKSKWKAESVVYHEFGHAADWQNEFKFNKSVTDLMKKHRSILRQDNGYSQVERKAYEMGYKSQMNEDWDTANKCMAVSDTIMSLNSNYGQGHSKAYFKIKGMSEAEFLAHAFENKFAGNDVFKEIMPELYDDTIKLIEELKTKLK
ncbi:hypothetical protein FEM08_13380 [Flavobacterium gilvum]|nr:hypothetical protein FEM08_13380 [Flavobacterium gilvum]